MRMFAQAETSLSNRYRGEVAPYSCRVEMDPSERRYMCVSTMTWCSGCAATTSRARSTAECRGHSSSVRIIHFSPPAENSW